MTKKILFITNDFLDARISRIPLIRFIQERNECLDVKIYTCLDDSCKDHDELFFLGKRSDYIGNFKKLLKLKKQFDFDLIISRGIEYSIICGIIWFNTRKVFLLTGLGRMFGHKNPILSAIFKSVYILLLKMLKPKEVIVQNPDDYKELFKLSPKIVLGSGIIENKITKPFSRNSNKIVFVIASRLTKTKGIIQLIEGFLLACDEAPNIYLKVYGDLFLGKDDYDLFNSIVNQHVNIEYFGHTDSVDNEIQQADFIIYPTLYREGVPRFLIQALYFGKPIISTDMPGARECFDNNGILLNSKLLTKNSIKTSILEIIKMEYSVLALKSKNLYISKFATTKIYRQYETIFLNSLK